MKRSLFFSILLMSILSSCIHQVNIGQVLNDPSRYENKQVRLHGQVTNSVNAVVAGGYQINDGTGSMIVISNGGAPRKGTRVSLTGRVTPGISVAGQSFGVIVRERDRHLLRP